MPRQVRHLRGRPERELSLGGAPSGDTTPPLERRRRLAIRAKRALDRHGRACQCRVHVAVLEAPGEQHVVGRALVHRRGARARGEHVDRRRKWLGVDGHERRAVLGHVAIDGDHGCQRLAAIARRRPREGWLLGLDIARQRGARPQPVAREDGIVARHDGDDAGQRRRSGSVDGADPGVSVNAADEGDVQHAGQLDVAHVVALAADEAPVFLPAEARAEDARGSGISGARHLSPRPTDYETVVRSPRPSTCILLHLRGCGASFDPLGQARFHWAGQDQARATSRWCGAARRCRRGSAGCACADPHPARPCRGAARARAGPG